MDTLEQSLRRWVAERHLVDLNTAEWKPLKDHDGSDLRGIRGKAGAIGQKHDGTEVGVDLIQMQPGSAFPLHKHPGDHILYGIRGEGSVQIGEETVSLKAGDTCFIPAELPHAVTGPSDGEAFVFLAFGHPHKHVDAADRMSPP